METLKEVLSDELSVFKNGYFTQYEADTEKTIRWFEENNMRANPKIKSVNA